MAQGNRTLQFSLSFNKQVASFDLSLALNITEECPACLIFQISVPYYDLRASEHQGLAWCLIAIVICQYFTMPHVLFWMETT